MAEVDRLLAEDGSDQSHAEIMEGYIRCHRSALGPAHASSLLFQSSRAHFNSMDARARLLRSDRRAARTGDRWREQLDRLNRHMPSYR